MDEDFDLIDITLINMHLAVTRLSLASIHAAEGKVDAAITEYTKVLEFDPDIYLVYLNRGKLFWRKGEPQRAMDDLSRAIKLEPEVAQTYMCRGDISFKEGDLNSAREDYGKALELSPANEAVIKRLRRLRERDKNDQDPG
ncbi:MAG: tetratricopeptide repeat protein [Actinomycetota bacterium]